jgi:DNA-binding HxlR family transcriptional regulator
MRTPRTADPRVCSIDAAMKLIGEKWALLALREIALGQHRFDDIASNTGAPRDILAARLKSLEAAGVVRRKLYQERPPRHEYHLAKAGEQLFGVLHAIRDWGDRFVRDDPKNIVTFRHSCGAKLRLKMCCAACSEVIALGNVTGDREVHRSDLVRARS